MPSDVVIYTTGDKARGLGHVVRMRLLARLLTERGLAVAFASEPGTLGWDELARAGLPMMSDVMFEAVQYHVAAVGIVDIQGGPSLDLLKQIRATCSKVVTVYGGYSFPTQAPGADDAERLSNLVVCQSVFEFDRPAHVLQGARHLIIDPRFAECKPDQSGPVVVCMGATDKYDLTPRVVDALSSLGCGIWAPSGAPSLVPYLDGAALFVGAQGMAAYEALAAGVPCVLYGWVDNAVATADELARRQVAVSLGLWSDFDAVRLRHAAGWTLRHDLAWAGARDRAWQLVDGQGAARVANRICQLVGVPA